MYETKGAFLDSWGNAIFWVLSNSPIWSTVGHKIVFFVTGIIYFSSEFTLQKFNKSDNCHLPRPCYVCIPTTQSLPSAGWQGPSVEGGRCLGGRSCRRSGPLTGVRPELTVGHNPVIQVTGHTTWGFIESPSHRRAPGAATTWKGSFLFHGGPRKHLRASF